MMALPALAAAVAAVYVGKKILDIFTKLPICDPGPGGPAGLLPRTAFDFFSNQETKPDTPSSRDPNNND
jgi:hypothetical protein